MFFLKIWYYYLVNLKFDIKCNNSGMVRADALKTRSYFIGPSSISHIMQFMVARFHIGPALKKLSLVILGHKICSKKLYWYRPVICSEIENNKSIVI